MLFSTPGLAFDAVHVRYLEGVTLGFLVLRNLNGQILAYGELSQVADQKNGEVTHDLHFRFKDGSSFREITQFTQRGEFHLISEHVVQKGPSFKQESETWIETATGSVKVRTVENGKEKLATKQMDIPADVSNGLLFTLVKNIDTSESTVSMIAASETPRLLTLNISKAPGKTVSVGLIKHQALHYVVKIKINGIAGVVAPLVGKQPPDIHIWVAKSDVPTFVGFEGPLTPDSPVWRIELTAPQQGVATK
jgi:hypothetical protein